MAWSRSVFSSMVTTVAWDDGNLLVTWARNGRTSVYSGVPEDVADRLSKAPSVGSMIHSDIIPYYSHSYA
jgi:hypothetical protein